MGRGDRDAHLLGIEVDAVDDNIGAFGESCAHVALDLLTTAGARIVLAGPHPLATRPARRLRSSNECVRKRAFPHTRESSKDEEGLRLAGRWRSRSG